EHGSGSESNLVSQLQALEAYDTVPVVRVEDNSRPRYSFALDRGAAGIMVPRVDSARDAALAVSFLRYPPDGIRGVAGLNRACDFGTRTTEVVPSFNQTVLGIMQIETARALDDVEEIAGTDGVDVLFVGPMDLSHSMGIPGDLEHPQFQAALKRISESARAAGKSAGIHVASTTGIAKYAEQGFGMIAIGSDSSLMLNAMRDTIAAAR
ncbi:MAG: HpcH/HpaI aldolase/citrate lyase family protein, partial [Acidimicrobiia bacterium]